MRIDTEGLNRKPKAGDIVHLSYGPGGVPDELYMIIEDDQGFYDLIDLNTGKKAGYSDSISSILNLAFKDYKYNIISNSDIVLTINKK